MGIDLAKDKVKSPIKERYVNSSEHSPVFTCVQVSLTFDPFSVLSVPVPKKKQSITLTFFSAFPRQKPVKVSRVLTVKPC